MRRILLLCGNAAYSRQYELMGPADINERLQALKPGSVQNGHNFKQQCPPQLTLSAWHDDGRCAKSLQLSATDQRLLDHYRQSLLPQPDRPWLQIALAEGPAKVKSQDGGVVGELAPSTVKRDKMGDAYGFYLDTTWFCDTVSVCGSVLSALMYARSDGELGDNR